MRVLFFSFSLFPLVNVIAWVRGQFKINFVCIFGVFPKLPESRCDEGNFGKTLKLQVNDNCTMLKAGDRCHPFWVLYLPVSLSKTFKSTLLKKKKKGVLSPLSFYFQVIYCLEEFSGHNNANISQISSVPRSRNWFYLIPYLSLLLAARIYVSWTVRS